MHHIFNTTKEWGLAIACLFLLMTQLFPQAVELVYPIIDWQGGNRLEMEVSKDMREGKSYQCGEMVLARFMLQKQRNAVGEIQWKLCSNTPGGNAYVYQTRIVSSHIGITDHWAKVETLPDICMPGKYHFEGTVSYPVMFGKVIYTIRTVPFLVKERKEPKP